MIAGPHSLRGDALYGVQIFPVILGQPFAAHGPVEPFDVGILLWLARLDIFELYAPCPGPIDNCRAQVFGSAIAPNGQGLSPPAEDLLERADHALGPQREVIRIDTPRPCTARTAISRRRDGLTTFFLAPPSRSRPPAPSCEPSAIRPCRHTWNATFRTSPS